MTLHTTLEHQQQRVGVDHFRQLLDHPVAGAVAIRLAHSVRRISTSASSAPRRTPNSRAASPRRCSYSSLFRRPTRRAAAGRFAPPSPFGPPRPFPLICPPPASPAAGSSASLPQPANRRRHPSAAIPAAPGPGYVSRWQTTRRQRLARACGQRRRYRGPRATKRRARPG